MTPAPFRSAATAACALIALALLCAAPAAAKPRSAGVAAQGVAGHAMVAAANPLATEAGLEVLRAGGTAADAAVAVQAVLGLVEPQSSGLGGGAFMVYRDGRSGRVTSYDGRETAPAGATPQLFYGEDGKPLPFFDAVLSGRSTGAPGAIAMLELAQREHGRRPWGSLFARARTLARDGFTVSPRLAGMISGRAPQAQTPDARRYFSRPDGTPLRAGDRLRNPLYADALARIASQGAAGLLRGPVAAEIAARVQAGPRPGALGVADLAAYRPLEKPALCRPYRIYVVCAPQTPSGGVGLLELLGVLEPTDIARRGPADPQAWVLFSQASRLAYADRDRYEGDPAFVHVPTAGMLDPAYDRARAALIPMLAGPTVAAGDPPGAPSAGADATAEPGGTSSFAIVDRWGNVVSMTTTVESIFGSGRMAHGFFLNNQLTDFSFTPTRPDGGAAANAVAAGKRPRSSMTPVIVLDRQGRFVAAVGSPGGNAIIAYVAKALVATLDWRMQPRAALALPNLVARPAKTSLETGAPAAVAQALRATGQVVDADAGEESGLHMIVAAPGGGYRGAADPRREGVALGW
ncbi:MAG: gamma-glutamyltransferase family protein [Caulobacteraceae bacterium]|nr:gamma-glutamyltransferase family protein [Caulobacter sp.]